MLLCSSTTLIGQEIAPKEVRIGEEITISVDSSQVVKINPGVAYFTHDDNKFTIQFINHQTVFDTLSISLIDTVRGLEIIRWYRILPQTLESGGVKYSPPFIVKDKSPRDSQEQHGPIKRFIRIRIDESNEDHIILFHVSVMKGHKKRKFKDYGVNEITLKVITDEGRVALDEYMGGRSINDNWLVIERWRLKRHFQVKGVFTAEIWINGALILKKKFHPVSQ